MGIFSIELFEELEKLEPDLRRAFIKILKTIEKNLGEVVKKEDFLELKRAVEVLTEKLNVLTEKVEALAQAQAKTEEEIRKLAEGLRKTREDLDKLRKDFGGFSRSMSYAFENEAYRNLPRFLKEKHGIEILERFVRTEIQEEEINFFARGKRNGKEVYIVGEATLRLEENKKDFERTFKELERKVEAV
ncbi:MAG: hypothetical protein RMI74_03300, partial [Thermodesulfobacterium sp.]|nr:hypothetical protein [Thermodesulfobacterium sp.]